MSARDGALIGEMDAGKVGACAGGVIPTSGDRRRGVALLGGLTTGGVRDILRGIVVKTTVQAQANALIIPPSGGALQPSKERKVE